MISIENLSYSFPEKELYNNISFTLEGHQHCAFIGTSGTGKSTLIDLLLHPDQYLFDGKVDILPHFRFGYVSQFSELENNQQITVFDYLAEEFNQVQLELTTLCTEMETATEIDSLLQQYQHSLDHFEAIGGNEFESKITKTLNLAGLNRHQQLNISQLSGGEFKLIQVIKAMLVSPDLLIMDEPDVFLDFDRLIALKDLINSYKGMLLVITHNRFLLHHCFNKIIHLEDTQLQEFDGRYVDYHFALLQLKIELQEQAQQEADEIERNRQIVERMRTDATNTISAKKGRAVNARATQLKRLEERRIKEPFVEIKQPDINLNTTNEVADVIALAVDDYCLAFDETLLNHVSFEIKSTDKVALIGPNGTGKTTLLWDIFNNKHDSIKINEEMNIALLSQIQGQTLNEANTILEEFEEIGFNTETEIQLYLKSYGFKDILQQQIKALSGGEKNILQLAKIAASNANLLLLDEPTSHLDTYSQIALQAAIEQYNGAILMVSHDFYTIANCVDYILLIENQTIRKISSRKFRKINYAKHFDKNYLELEQKKKELETSIAIALQNKDVELAKSMSERLAELIKML